MEESNPELQTQMSEPKCDPAEKGAQFWYEQYLKQKEDNQHLHQQLRELHQEIERLKEKIGKQTKRSSKNSSQPPSQDGYKKKNKSKSKLKGKRKQKQGPKYGHPGKTRNGFDSVEHHLKLTLEQCPQCGAELERVVDAPVRRQQIAELVPAPVAVWEYERPLYRCRECGWQGYAPLPLGCREDFSYGGLLSALVGWLGYGGHLSWGKQRYLVEMIFGIPLSQGSLAKMHQWFCESLYPRYEQWWEWIQQPGVRCVDETSYRLGGVNYWMWVATSAQACVLFFAPTRSAAEVKSLLGEDFSGILTTDCWSAYSRQSAAAKQKCLAHIERELKALQTSRFASNRQFAASVLPILQGARQLHQDYHAGQLSREQLQQGRGVVEALLDIILNHPPQGGWAEEAQKLANRFRRHWEDWFTFLSHPEVKPDNNDAERALRPVVVHRKVSGGARSHWGGQLVAMMFSFLETMRLQGKSAVEELFHLLSHWGRPPPPPEALPASS